MGTCSLYVQCNVVSQFYFVIIAPNISYQINIFVAAQILFFDFRQY